MNGLTSVIAATAVFVGTHFLLSHPLRAPLVARIGTRGFQLLYTLVALATFGWMVVAIGDAGLETVLWTAPIWLWWLSSALMLVASVLLVGSLIGNPALPAPGARAKAARHPRGVFAITRHPMMWSFALWGVVHIAVWPTPSNIVVGLGVILLALGGSLGQDVKKAKLMGDDWRGWMSRTAFVPFAGPSPLSAMWPGWLVLLAGVALWLLATWAHIPFGGQFVGVWR